MDSDKAQLRHRLRQILARMPAAVREQKSLQICSLLLGAEEYEKASVVMLFLSMSEEVDTTPILQDAWRQKKTVVVPKIAWEQKTMIPVVIHSLDSGFCIDKKGLRNPIASKPVPLEAIDLVITPGLGFDRQGNRLGRGGAYYDRFFASKELHALRWALAFSEQIADDIPRDKMDVPVDVLVCETEIIRCKQRQQDHGG
jgi:5-formyltetrahydrofolate cyclo-ligase